MFVGTFTDGLILSLSAGMSEHCFVVLVGQSCILVVMTVTFTSPTGNAFLLSAACILGDSTL